ncbi:MAG: hypothetical protein P8X74_05965 [Reinekea sp.]
MLPENWGEPMGAPAIFEKQIEIKLLHPASTLESRIQDRFRTLHQYACTDTMSVGLHPERVLHGCA